MLQILHDTYPDMVRGQYSLINGMSNVLPTFLASSFNLSFSLASAFSIN